MGATIRFDVAVDNDNLGGHVIMILSTASRNTQIWVHSTVKSPTPTRGVLCYRVRI